MMLTPCPWLRSIVNFGQQQELVHDIGRVLDLNLPWKFGQHPDFLTFAQGSGCVVTEAAVSNDRVQEPKGLKILDRDVAVANDTENITGVRTNRGLPRGYVIAIVGIEWFEFNPVVEPGSGDWFTGSGGLIELGPKAMPRNLPDVHHGGFAIGGSQIMSHF